MRRIVLSVRALALILVLAAAGGFVWLYSRADASTVGELSFQKELSIPRSSRHRPMAPVARCSISVSRPERRS
jgi:hypothetical protein